MNQAVGKPICEPITEGSDWEKSVMVVSADTPVDLEDHRALDSH